MESPSVFTDLEWAVARVRRQTNQYNSREEETPGKGRALLNTSLHKLDEAVYAWVEAINHSRED